MDRAAGGVLRWICLLVVLLVFGCKSESKTPPTPDEQPRVQETPVEEGVEIDDIAIGSEHLCVLADGRVYCAGDQTDPLTFRLAAATEWRPIEMPEKVVAIASSNLRTCAVTESKKLACWGGYNHLPRRVEAVENVEDASVFGRYKVVSRDGGIISYDNAYAIRRDGEVVRIIGESGQPMSLEKKDVVKWDSVDYLCDDCEHFGYWVTLDGSGAVEWGQIRAEDGDKYPSLATLVSEASDISMSELEEAWNLAIFAIVEGRLKAFSLPGRGASKEGAKELEIEGPDDVERVDGQCAKDREGSVWCFHHREGEKLVFVRAFDGPVEKFAVEKNRVCAKIDAIECVERASVIQPDGAEIQYVKAVEPIPLHLPREAAPGRSDAAD